MRGDSLFDIRPIDRAAQQSRDRRDTALGNTTRHDQIEVVEIGSDVQREPVARNPSGDADANRRKLVATDPDAGESFDAPGVDAVVARGTNQHVFEVADVAVDVAAIRPEIDDGIPDDLAGSVVGDVAAASGLVHLDAAGRKRFGRREDVTTATIAAYAKRQYVRMLDEQEQIADVIRAPLFNERPLQRERLGIAHHPETP